MGVALGFIIGPLLVAAPNNSTNHTNHTNRINIHHPADTDLFGPHGVGHSSMQHDDTSNGNSYSSGGEVGVGERNLNHMLLCHAVLAILCLVAMLLYFPAKPAVPPSRSAAARNQANSSSAITTNAAPSGNGGSKATLRKAFQDLGHALCGLGSRDVRTLWVVSIVFALPLGVYSGWGAVLVSIEINKQENQCSVRSRT